QVIRRRRWLRRRSTRSHSFWWSLHHPRVRVRLHSAAPEGSDRIARQSDRREVDWPRWAAVATSACLSANEVHLRSKGVTVPGLPPYLPIAFREPGQRKIAKMITEDRINVR